MPYRTLNAVEIVTTLHELHARISDRFPDSGLSNVCRELIAIGEQTQQRASAIATPHFGLRVAVNLLIAGGIAGLAYVAISVKLPMVGTPEIFGVFQGVEAAMNIVVLVGATLFFLVSLETRLKRRRSLAELHVFRSIAHVIDMHQLTKDPSSIMPGAAPTAHSPQRRLSRFELTRYLDYCSEMLSLSGKLAALYAQNLPDDVVIDAVNDIEQLTTNLSNKIWQKITILDAGQIG